ncbi:hypothetical protein [Rufibacter immobilis]|uniref:hypothetical protein n=1 Tax=Rufibacter immobilis TaxID=1348778 RepID=UPI0035EA949A
MAEAYIQQYWLSLATGGGDTSTKKGGHKKTCNGYATGFFYEAEREGLRLQHNSIQIYLSKLYIILINKCLCNKYDICNHKSKQLITSLFD